MHYCKPYIDESNGGLGSEKRAYKGLDYNRPPYIFVRSYMDGANGGLGSEQVNNTKYLRLQVSLSSCGVSYILGYRRYL